MRYEIRAKVRTYKDKQSGEEKSVYATIGSAWLDDDKKSIQLDTVPVNWDGRAWLNERYNKEEKQTKDTVIDDISDEPISLQSIPF